MKARKEEWRGQNETERLALPTFTLNRPHSMMHLRLRVEPPALKGLLSILSEARSTGILASGDQGIACVLGSLILKIASAFLTHLYPMMLPRQVLVLFPKIIYFKGIEKGLSLTEGLSNASKNQLWPKSGTRNSIPVSHDGNSVT